MNDLIKAKDLLCSGDYTCVLCHGDTVYTDCKRGIAPMLERLGQGVDLKGFSVADKIVGKAAAMLFALAGITEVHARVMSQPAAELLHSYGIRASWDTLTDRIINRSGDGLCPMEETVSEIHDLDVAFLALKVKYEQLRKGL